MFTIENPRKFSKRIQKCIQKGDKKDLQKELLNSFEVLKTFRDYKGKIHVKKTFNETTINWDKNKDFLALTPPS